MNQAAFDALGMRHYIWRYPRGSYIQERWFDLGNPGKISFNGHRGMLTLIAIFFSILFLVACASQTPVPSPGNGATEARPTDSGAVEAAPSIPTSPASPPVQRSDAAPASGNQVLQGSVVVAEDSRTGISVTGSGKASATPDLAVLNLGVEAFAGSVAEARDQAAGAMDEVVKILLAGEILKEDIQTRNFNIFPRYTTREVTRCLGANLTDCFQDRDRVIIGYQVTNQLSVQVRDLNSVGSHIDRVTATGGDLIRFQGVSFSIEDTQALEIEAREAAAADLMAKASQIANLTGVVLGKPVFITEVSRSTPKTLPLADLAFARAGAAVETPILPGEQDVVITLQARYAIQ